MSAFVASVAGLRAPRPRAAPPPRLLAPRRVVAPVAATSDADRAPSLPARRDALARGAVAFAAASLLSLAPGAAFADSLPEEEPTRLLCDASCEAALADVELVTTKSGLQYKDIVVGDGVQPEVGFQCVVDYIAKNEKGQIFDNSLEKGKPNDIRVTGDPESANVIPGLDEGLLTMRSDGIGRLYIRESSPSPRDSPPRRGGQGSRRTRRSSSTSSSSTFPAWSKKTRDRTSGVGRVEERATGARRGETFNRRFDPVTIVSPQTRSYRSPLGALSPSAPRPGAQ